MIENQVPFPAVPPQSAILSLEIERQAKFVDTGTQEVFMRSQAWYNGRERAVATLFGTRVEPYGDRLLVVYGEGRHGGLFVDYLILDGRSYFESEIAWDRIDGYDIAYRRRVNFQEGNYPEASRYIWEQVGIWLEEPRVVASLSPTYDGTIDEETEDTEEAETPGTEEEG